MKEKNCGVFIKGDANLQDSVDKIINRTRESAMLEVNPFIIKQFDGSSNVMLESIKEITHSLAMEALGLMESVTIADAYSKRFNTPWTVDVPNIDPIELSVAAVAENYEVEEEFIRRFGSEEKFLKDHTKIKPSKIKKELSNLSDLLTCMACNNADPGEFRRVVKYSRDVIDSEKDTNGCFRWSYIYYDIADLKEKYMNKENEDANYNDIIKTPDFSIFNALEIEAEYKKRFGCSGDINLTSSATNTKTRKFFDDYFSKSTFIKL